MTLPLADIKAIAAAFDVTVVANRWVPRGEMVIVDPTVLGPFLADLTPGKRVLAVNPQDFDPYA